MNAPDRLILQEFASRVRAEIDPCARIWAYGSRVRGDSVQDSDLDICVVLSGRLTHHRRRAVGHIAWEIGFAHDMLVQDVVFSDDAFERGPMSAHPLVRAIRREGLAA